MREVLIVLFVLAVTFVLIELVLAPATARRWLDREAKVDPLAGWEFCGKEAGRCECGFRKNFAHHCDKQRGLYRRPAQESGDA